MDWYLKVLKEYVNFSGRARRKEFWMFALFHTIFIFMLYFLLFYSFGFDLNNDSNPNPSGVIIIGLLILVYILGTFLPSLAVTVRRLHDTGKSGWWYCISFVPYIGWLALMILLCFEGDNGPNPWGNNPKGIGNDTLIDKIGTE